MADEMTKIAFVGNCYFEHPVSVHKDDGFLKLVDLLRGYSATFANMECTLHDGKDWPAFGGGMGWAGTYMPAPPAMIDEMKFLGIDGVYAANNHVADFGEGGILTTTRFLEERNMPFAGIGASLTEASRPCYVETPTARVALISAADWGPRQLMELPFPWPAGYMPSDELRPFISRPGVNLVRYEAVVHIDEQAFNELRRISGELGWEKPKMVRRMGGARTEPLVGPTLVNYEVDTDTEFFFMGRKFVLDNEFKISTFAFQEDLDRIFDSVAQARQQADIVIVALHDQSHSNGVLDFIDTLAHGSIDAGADVYINHGGYTRGIEIYKDKAIFYGQPGFHLQNDQVSIVPRSNLVRMGLSADAKPTEFLERRTANRKAAIDAGGQLFNFGAENYVQVTVFSPEGELKEIEIRPIGEPIMPGPVGRKGVPVLLEPGTERFNRTLQGVADRCKPFGTEVEIEDGIGRIRL